MTHCSSVRTQHGIHFVISHRALIQTQYPVMPWVLNDYHSDSIDLRDKKIYRDLSKPMGAVNAERAEKFRARFESLQEVEEEHCFMYGM